MSKYHILREKQNIAENKKRITNNNTRVFKRTNIVTQRNSQQKRKHDQVELEPKVPVPSKTLARHSDKLIARQNLDATCDKIDEDLEIIFNGPRETFHVKAVLGNVEKIPLPKHTAEDVHENSEMPTAIKTLNAAIEDVEISDNSQEDNVIASKTVEKVTNTLHSNNALQVAPAIPVVTEILNATAVDIEANSRKSLSDDQFYLTEYHKDIFKYLIDLESKLTKPRPGYMDKQPEVTSAMRSKLVDWVVHVFKGINDKVLHMTVHFIDTFLSRMSVVKSKLQLLACAAGMIACKTEEVCIQATDYWTILGGNTFTKKQLLKMERMILSVMKFEVSRPTIICFIRYICYVNHVRTKVARLAYYISELILVEGDEYLRYSPSLLACAAIALARHTLGEDEIWSKELESGTKYMIQELLPVIGMLLKTLRNAPNTPYTNVYNKYLHKDCSEVAALKLKDFNPKDII